MEQPKNTPADMTPTQPSQAEAAVRRLMNLVASYGHLCGAESYHQRGEKDALAADARRDAEKLRVELESTIRAELARPLEVAAVGDMNAALLKLSAETHKEVDDAIHSLQNLEGSAPMPVQWWSIVLMALYRASLIGAASRVPVALTADMNDLSVTSILLDVTPGFDGMGHEVYAKSVKEVEDRLSAIGQELEEWQLGIRSHAVQPASPAPKQGDAKDARPDSFHSDSGECDRVQRVELSGDELALFQRTLDDFADCGETETDHEVLVNWARRGLLECTNFRPTAAAHRMLAPSTSTDQKGNAA